MLKAYMEFKRMAVSKSEKKTSKTFVHGSHTGAKVLKQLKKYITILPISFQNEAVTIHTILTHW